jgi:hypothetical protein
MRRHFDLPSVRPRYAAALRAALDAAFTLTDPDALVVCGSIVAAGLSGPEPDPSSDFDIFVLHEPAWRQRVQRRIAGVPCEFFIDPALQVQRDFAEEAATGRPVSLDMFAHGAIAYDPLGRAAILTAQARALLAAGWRAGEAELTQRRYAAASLLEDARDVAARDALAANLLLAQALNVIVEYAFAARGMWLPRAKERGAAFAAVDAGSHVLLEACFREGEIEQRLRSAERLAERVLGQIGFFEWVGPREAAASTGL